MESPFIFGKIAKGRSFIDRKSEMKQLSSNFKSGINTMIISPRRWGKSSLVQKAAEKVSQEKKKIRICHLDMYRIHDEQHFFESFAHEVIKASSNKWEDWIGTAKELLKGTVSSVSIGTDPAQDFKLNIPWDDIKKEANTILELPEKIARKDKIKFVICIDEFQKVSEFKNSLFLQERLRSHWQNQVNTSYCLYGSKRHVFTSLFVSESQPFYRFGDLILLQRIKQKHWLLFIEKQFSDTGKVIGKNIINRILAITGNHPYHIQQLTHYIWRLTEHKVDVSIFQSAVEELLLNNEILFKRELEHLTPLQINYLTALVHKEQQMNSMQVITKYNLGSPGNLSTIKAALENKEIIDFYETEPIFINPLFEFWLKNSYLV